MKRVVRVDLVVHLAVDEQQLARQPVRDVHVGGTGPGLGIARAVVGQKVLAATALGWPASCRPAVVEAIGA